MSTGNVTYLATGPGYWGRGGREGEAKKQLKRAGYTGKEVHLYRFTGKGHERAYITTEGMISWPKGVNMEELTNE